MLKLSAYLKPGVWHCSRLWIYRTSFSFRASSTAEAVASRGRKRERERERESFALIKNKDDARMPRSESVSARNHRQSASSRPRLFVFIHPRIYLFGKLLKSVKLASMLLSLRCSSKCLYRVQCDTDRQRMRLASWTLTRDRPGFRKIRRKIRGVAFRRFRNAPRSIARAIGGTKLTDAA